MKEQKKRVRGETFEWMMIGRMVEWMYGCMTEEEKNWFITHEDGLVTGRAFPVISSFVKKQ